ncbi:MAG: antibiotic biosynthesis monooxygenase [Gammaproteobacteria bacterium]|nr:antibiotic biosynthesis monooxygenase [Gammaproteobacteria bacterium]
MIVINVIVETNQDNITALKDAIAAMEASSRAEAECQDYTFSVELNDPNKLRITERWENPAVLQAHFASVDMADHQAKRTTVHCYDATEIPIQSLMSDP